MKISTKGQRSPNVTNLNKWGGAAASGQQVDGIAASGNMPTGAYSTSTSRQAYVGAAGGFGADVSVQEPGADLGGDELAGMAAGEVPGGTPPAGELEAPDADLEAPEEEPTGPLGRATR